ncbi:MAG: hypothetical protein LUG93_02730 [Lachnospiraceae bacterium]|nr:hypothetical protein [Lachnospiraceae bacterium]
MRVFIGIALSGGICRTLAEDAEKLYKTILGRYVARDNYHITMAFIGETDQNGIAGIKRTMITAVVSMICYLLYYLSSNLVRGRRPHHARSAF